MSTTNDIVNGYDNREVITEVVRTLEGLRMLTCEFERLYAALAAEVRW